jgi:hypothetical protein
MKLRNMCHGISPSELCCCALLVISQVLILAGFILAAAAWNTGIFVD